MVQLDAYRPVLCDPTDEAVRTMAAESSAMVLRLRGLPVRLRLFPSRRGGLWEVCEPGGWVILDIWPDMSASFIAGIVPFLPIGD